MRVHLDGKPKCGMKKVISKRKFYRIFTPLYARRQARLITTTVCVSRRAASLRRDFYYGGLLYREEQDLTKPVPECYSYYRYDLRRLQ